MSAHTKGPWQWTSGERPIDIGTFESPGFYGNAELRGPNGEGIITCDEYEVHGKVEDARLIAAAPELLEALADLLAACPTSCEDKALIEAQRKAEAALAKAEGRTPRHE